MIKDRLKIIAELFDLTKADIARKTGAHPQSVYYYFSGERIPQIDFIIAMRKAYNIDPLWLLCSEGEITLSKKGRGKLKSMLKGLDDLDIEILNQVQQLEQDQKKKIARVMSKEIRTMKRRNDAN